MITAGKKGALLSQNLDSHRSPVLALSQGESKTHLVSYGRERDLGSQGYGILAGNGLSLFKAEAEDSRVFDLRHYGYEDSWQEGSAGAF